MPDRAFNPNPVRLTEVLPKDVLEVLVTGYCTLTRSPISVMESGEDETVYVDPKLFRSPVCELADSRAQDLCAECDRRHVLQVLKGEIKAITPYLCPFGQVDIVVPVRIGTQTVAALFGGQVPFSYWPEEMQSAIVERAVKEGVLKRVPDRRVDAGRASLMDTLEELGITDVSVDALLEDAAQYMRDEQRELDMRRYLSLLETKARVIEGLANDVFFADLLPHLSSLIEDRGAGSRETGVDSHGAEKVFWQAVLSAIGVVRRTMGFASALVLANSEEAPGGFDIKSVINLPKGKQRYTLRHKGPLRVGVALLEDATSGTRRGGARHGARDTISSHVRCWLEMLDIQELCVEPIALASDAQRYAIAALFGAEPSTEGMEHPGIREREWLTRVLDHLSASMQRRFAAIALRRRAEVQEQFSEDLTHELKAPFQAILAQADALIGAWRTGRPSEKLISEAERRVGVEQREVHTRMSNMSLLAPKEFAKLVHKQPHRLGKLITESVERHREAAAEREMKLQAVNAQDPDSLALADIDEESFQLVVDNLVQNAVKYSYPRTTVRIETFSTTDEVGFRVRNIGARIPQEKYKDIFRKFVRLTPEEMQFSFRPGTGIGLALVHRVVVDLHGGEVSVESEEAPSSLIPPGHEGATPHMTTFVVKLPRYSQ